MLLIAEYLGTVIAMITTFPQVVWMNCSQYDGERVETKQCLGSKTLSIMIYSDFLSLLILYSKGLIRCFKVVRTQFKPS